MSLFTKLWNSAKYVAETTKGAIVVLASPNMKIPPTKLDSHMPPRPWLLTEWIRMFSWRYNWQYMPVFRFWVFSALIVFSVYKFLLPIKPRHHIMMKHMTHKLHEFEVSQFHARSQKREDDLYFKKTDPFRNASGH